MTELFFITGNVNKFHEIQSFIPTLKQLDMDLPEIQSLDVKEIVRRKFEYAREYRDAQFIVEDTSLHLKCLHGLPGPFIKWFLQAIGDEGLFQIAKKLGNTKATARTIIGYSAGNRNILFFEGTSEGHLCAPKGTNGFGWDRIFLPDGETKTFAEMDDAEKQLISMRTVALEKLKDFWTKNQK